MWTRRSPGSTGTWFCTTTTVQPAISAERAPVLESSMATVLDLNLTAGRMLNETDEDNRSTVAVIGTDVVDNLFPSQDPLGMEVRLDGQLYRVIGVGEKQGKTLGQSLDNYIAIPISAYLKQYGAHTSIRVSGKAHGVGNQLNAAIDEVRVVLRARRHDAPGQPDSFVAETNENFLSLWKNLTQTLFITITAIAAIALVVGGIVIMNIMLVSVTERTREIGVRKAMGARRQDVLMQFLIESATVALLGGCLGVLFGISFAKSITALIGMPSSVQLWAVVTALTASGVKSVRVASAAGDLRDIDMAHLSFHANRTRPTPPLVGIIRIGAANRSGVRGRQRFEAGEAGGAVRGEVARLPPCVRRIEQPADSRAGRDAEGGNVPAAEGKRRGRPGAGESEQFAEPAPAHRPFGRQ